MSEAFKSDLGPIDGWDQQALDVADANLEVFTRGEGQAVVMHPSLGRPAQDFEDLGNRVAAAGYSVVLVNPRGIGASTGTMDGVTLQDLAGDVWAAADSLGIDHTAVLGQNFGNRVARTISSLEPDRVTGLILMAAGGEVEPSQETWDEFRLVFDPKQTKERHLEAVANSFFAKGNDASVWTDGWHPETAMAQVKATQNTDFGPLYTGGTAPMLVIQGLDDVIAPAENGWHLVNNRADAQLVAFPNMGHAMLPENPTALASTVIDFLGATQR